MVNEHDTADDHVTDEMGAVSSDSNSESDSQLSTQQEHVTKLEEEKTHLQDELQRAKADFLNARRRLEDERMRDRIRYKKEFLTTLLPLCDSFQMAMSDAALWEKADPAWRKGVEGIYTQLQTILTTNGVRAFDPAGQTFDPYRHEAVGTEIVVDSAQQDTVISVMQSGYELTHDGETDIIRPARVTTGYVAE